MYIAFDTETTGLSHDSQVLTVYFIILDNLFNKIDDLYLSIKYSTYHVSSAALLCNKINLVDHTNLSISIEDANISLENFLVKNKLDDTFIPIGHNVDFDIKMIKKELISNNNYISYFKDKTIDTLSIARTLKKQHKLKSKSLSLSNLCIYLNIELLPSDNDDGFHDAKYDTLMTVELYKALRNIL
jgi:DNA polymerase III epsilon subunit-like protein